jgi:hypothetical protein
MDERESRVKTGQRSQRRPGREASAPRMWGCLANRPSRSDAGWLRPTHVGVSPTSPSGRETTPPPPHACGGVSGKGPGRFGVVSSAPRMWGCLVSNFVHCGHSALRPTHVGVSPAAGTRSGATCPPPHACGGVSAALAADSSGRTSAPRMWGCLAAQAASPTAVELRPTHVGVSRCVLTPRAPQLAPPHACGGVSGPYAQAQRRTRSAPRMWGYLGPARQLQALARLRPTRVGVTPRRTPRPSGRSPPPHVRGGDSAYLLAHAPRMWGCLGCAVCADVLVELRPTHVGVSPMST